MTADFHYRNSILGIEHLSLLNSNIYQGLMVSKSTFLDGSAGSFLGRREYEFA